MTDGKPIQSAAAPDQHGVAEAKNKLSELIERAEHGEEIVITRHGKPVVKLSGMPPTPATKQSVRMDLDWLKARRTGRGRPQEDAGALVSRMRDEEWIERLSRR